MCTCRHTATHCITLQRAESQIASAFSLYLLQPFIGSVAAIYRVCFSHLWSLPKCKFWQSVAAMYILSVAVIYGVCRNSNFGRLIFVWNMTRSYMWHDSFICVSWLHLMCNKTHSYAWQDSFICMIWSMHMCDTTLLYVWHDPFICMTRLLHLCAMTHAYVWHNCCVMTDAEFVQMFISNAISSVCMMIYVFMYICL